MKTGVKKRWRIRLLVLGTLLSVGQAVYLLFLRPPRPLPAFRTLQNTGGVSDLAFLPDGKTLVAAGKLDRVAFYDVTTGEETRVIDGPTHGLGVSGEKRRLMVTGFAKPNRTLVRLWDTESGRLVTSFPIIPLLEAYSRDLTLLAVRSKNGYVLYDTNTGRPRHTLPAPDVMPGSPGFTSHFSPDGKRFAAGHAGEHNGVALWDTTTGKPIPALAGKSMDSPHVRFSPDGVLLATAGQKGPITLWDTRDWDRVRSIPTRLDHTSYIRFTMDGRLLVAVGGKIEPASRRSEARSRPAAQAWEIATGRETAFFREERLIRVGPFGTLLMTLPEPRSGRGRDGKAVHLRDAATGRLQAVLSADDLQNDDAFPWDPFAFAFSPDGRLVAAGDFDSGIIRIWRIPRP